MHSKGVCVWVYVCVCAWDGVGVSTDGKDVLSWIMEGGIGRISKGLGGWWRVALAGARKEWGVRFGSDRGWV